MLISALIYVATSVFVVGVGRKIIQYATTPAPLKIPTTPAPTTRSGVVWRMFKEVFFFESLFKASKFTWLFGWLFHAGFFVALLGHLRYFTEPVWGWVVLIAPFSKYAGMAMIAGLIGLLVRRCLVDRVRVISAPSDYLMLVLILLIALSGLTMRYAFHVDIIGVKQYALGLLRLNIGSFPGGGVLILHLLLVAILLIIFPFSKLLHAPGLFFSPSRYQVDNPRERRHAGRIADGRSLHKPASPDPALNPEAIKPAANNSQSKSGPASG